MSVKLRRSQIPLCECESRVRLELRRSFHRQCAQCRPLSARFPRSCLSGCPRPTPPTSILAENRPCTRLLSTILYGPFAARNPELQLSSCPKFRTPEDRF